MIKRYQKVLFTVLMSCTFNSIVYASSPFKPVTLPELNIPNNSCNVKDYGAEATGIWYDTDAFQAAIDDCANKGGGTVIVPAGYYLTKPLFLKDNINFHLDKNAVLQATAEESAFRVTDKNKPWAGIEKLWPTAETWLAFINIADGNNIAITGEGIIDGQGAVLLEKFRSDTRLAGKKGPTNRPRLFFIKNSHNILIEGVTIQNSPSFHVVFYNVDDITINNTQIIAPAWWQNTDAIDPMHSRNVTITNNYISVGDDHIAIKAIFNDNNTHDFYIANNHFEQGRGLSIGSESSGGISNLLAENNHFENSMYGIRIKSPRGKGGEVDNIQYIDTTMVNVGVPIVLSGYYKGGPVTKNDRTQALQQGEFTGGFMLGDQIYPADSEEPHDYDKFKTPYFNNITFKNLTSAGSSKYVGFIIGTPEKPFSNIQLSNIDIAAEEGLKIRNADVSLDDVILDVKVGKAIIAEKGSKINVK